jgi:hypothetical protein
MKEGENTFSDPTYVGYYFAVKVRMDESVYVTQRVVTNMLTALSNVGGFLSILSLIFSYLVSGT